MRLPSFKRIIAQDYQSTYTQLVNQLGNSLNYGIQILYQTLSNNVTLRDNIKSQVVDIPVIVDATGTPTQNGTIALTIQNATVDGLVVIGAANTNNTTTYPTGAIFISGAQKSNTYVINNITGLQATFPYTIRVVIFYQ